ncbi:MAG: T9SS type A sorting domain-containing protein [Bacteroidota bacterium]
MKKIINNVEKLLLSLFLLMTTFSYCYSDSGIDSLKVIPENPTINDTIKLLSYTKYPGGVVIDSSSVEFFEDSIIVNSYYTVIAPYDSYTYREDTIAIGNIPSPISGEIIQKAHIRSFENYDLYPDSALYFFSDTDTINFSISSLKKTIFCDFTFIIYPNPVKNRLKLKLNDYALRNEYQLEICSLSGQKLLSKNIYGTTVLNLSDYSPGIYLLTIKHNNKIIQDEKIIVE